MSYLTQCAANWIFAFIDEVAGRRPGTSLLALGYMYPDAGLFIHLIAQPPGLQRIPKVLRLSYQYQASTDGQFPPLVFPRL
jgi:hypothetical protein